MMRIPFQIPVEQEDILGIMSIPENGIKKHVALICYGFNGNKSDVHRISVKFGDYLENKGIPFIRFDYRGQGLSEGEMNETTLKSRVKDVCSVIEFIKGCFNSEHLAISLIGFSDGARIAAMVAEKIPVSNVIFWNPIFETQNSSYTKQEDGRKGNNMVRNIKSRTWSYQYYGLPVNITYLQELVEGNSIASLLETDCKKYSIWGEQDSFTIDSRKELSKLIGQYDIIPSAGHLFFGKESEEAVFDKTYSFINMNNNKEERD